MNRIRVVFEGECGNSDNLYWIGREGEKPIGQIRTDAGTAMRLHDLINETYYNGGCTYDCSYCHADEDED